MLVHSMTCMSGEESHKNKCLSDSLEQENATTFVDCCRKGLGKTHLLQVVLACHLILTIASADLLILLNPENIQGSFLPQDDVFL